MRRIIFSNGAIVYICTIMILAFLCPLQCFSQIWYFIPENSEYSPQMLVKDSAGDYWIGRVPPIYTKGLCGLDALQIKLIEDPNTFVNLFNNPNKGFLNGGKSRCFELENNAYSLSSFKRQDVKQQTSSKIVLTDYNIVSVDYSTMECGTNRIKYHSYSVEDIINGRFYTGGTSECHSSGGSVGSGSDTSIEHYRNTTNKNDNSWNKTRYCRKCHGSTVCTRCNGTGEVFSITYGVNKNIICPACGGSKKCSLCGGSGTENYISR